MTGAKLEVSAAHVDGGEVGISLGEDLPGIPESQYSTFDLRQPSLAQVMARREPRMSVDDGAVEQTCHIRLGTLLPGESARASDTLALRPSGPGRVVVRCRILAAELSEPLEREFQLKVEGASSQLDLEGLRAFLKEPLAQLLLATSSTTSK